MADTRYLKQRRQGWYFVMKVPVEVREAIGKAEIVASLRTRDLSAAQKSRWKLADEWTTKFEVAKAKRAWTAEEIEAKASDLFDRFLVDLHEVDEGADNLRLIVELERDREHADDLAAALSRARAAAAHGRLKALEGESYEKPVTFGRKAIDPVTLRPFAEPLLKRGVGFTEAAEGFLKEAQRDRAAALTEQTVGQYQATFRLFDSWAERPGLKEVTRPRASAFLQAVASLAPEWGRSPKTKARTFAEIVERYGHGPRGLSNKTLNRYATALSQVWQWADKTGQHTGPNPWERQRFKAAEKRATAKLPFRDDEMGRLLETEPVGEARALTIAETRLWVSWIAAFSGMRLNEICDRRTEELREEGGVWFFDVTRAKTEAGDRRVPVHSRLIALGLLKYAKHGDEWLFPALKPGGPDGKRSWYLSKRFTEFRRSKGVVRRDRETGRDLIDFHSFRRSVVACLERQHVPQSEVAQIVGHEKKGITFSVYSRGGIGLAALATVVELIDHTS